MDLGVRRDRKERGGGGCMTFIREGVPYKVIKVGVEQEYIVIGVWTENENEYN